MRAHHLASLGMVPGATGQLDASVQAYEHALALALADDQAQRAGMFEELSAVLERCGRWQEALQYHKRFHQLQMRLSAERVRRSARMAAVRLDIERERARARQLATTNAELRRRSDDLVARLGGEEFVALLDGDASVEGAFMAAEHLRLAAAMHPWSTVSPDLAVTISIGIACAGEAPDNETLLAVADRRLYAAKAAGRNRCVVRD